jgi:hypothetical protein
MNYAKSKLPDLKELTAMATKFLTDVKKSITEIADTYQQERKAEPQAPVTEKKPEDPESNNKP